MTSDGVAALRQVDSANSKDGPVEGGRQSFPWPSEYLGKRMGRKAWTAGGL
jgi:hypothetical protein